MIMVLKLNPVVVLIFGNSKAVTIVRGQFQIIF